MTTKLFIPVILILFSLSGCTRGCSKLFDKFHKDKSQYEDTELIVVEEDENGGYAQDSDIPYEEYIIDEDGNEVPYVTELEIIERVEPDIDIALEDTRPTATADLAAEVITEIETKPATPAVERPTNMSMVETKPQFPGGDAAMYSWLSSNISYPAQAQEEGASGKVTVSFIVEKDGSLTDVKVVRGKHPALDKEAVRVVKAMPKWQPGRNNGEAVRVSYMLPVTFKLQN